MNRTYDHSSDFIQVMRIRRLFFTYNGGPDLEKDVFQEGFSDEQIRNAGIIEEMRETVLYPQPVRVPDERQERTAALIRTGTLSRKPFQRR
jgi:hypothetical protein